VVLVYISQYSQARTYIMRGPERQINTFNVPGFISHARGVAR